MKVWMMQLPETRLGANSLRGNVEQGSHCDWSQISKKIIERDRKR